VHDHRGHEHPSLAKEKGCVEETVECTVDLVRIQPQCLSNYELVGGGEDWQLTTVGAGQGSGTDEGSAAPDAQVDDNECNGTNPDMS
jgi:hypothetical protein